MKHPPAVVWVGPWNTLRVFDPVVLSARLFPVCSVYCVCFRGDSSPLRRWLDTCAEIRLQRASYVDTFLFIHNIQLLTSLIILDGDCFSYRCAAGTQIMFITSGLYSRLFGSVRPDCAFAPHPPWNTRPDSDSHAASRSSIDRDIHGTGRH